MAGYRLVFALAVLASIGLCAANAPLGFIRAQDSRFVDKDCNEFNFVGTNAWRMPSMAAGTYPYADGSGWPTTSSWLIRPENPAAGPMSPALWAIRQMQTSNLTVLRVFGTGADASFQLTLQPGTAGADGVTWPNGSYNWNFVYGIEQIVEWCRAHGVKVMFTFLDNWSPVDSKTAFVNFAAQASGQSLTVDDFWSNPLCMQYYKNLVSFWLNHPNKLANGLQFKDDDTIIGWNLFNEPRCNCAPTVIDPNSGAITGENSGSDCANVKQCTADMKTWIAEMAAFVKSIAPMQLLGLGDEGFATSLNDQDPSTLVAANPGPWAIYTGDSFDNQAQNGIDYHSTHLWVDNWNVAEANSSDDNSVASSIPDPATSYAFDRQWLSTRKAIAAADGRPFVIEEFGKFVPRPVTDNDPEIQTIRDPWFREVFSQTNNSIFADEPLRGVMIWKYGETNIENATDKNWISVTDSTWTQIIEPYAMKISAYRPPVSNCKPGAQISSATVSVQTQSATLSAGRRLLAADSDGADSRRGVQYVTRGNHLIATRPGKALGEELTEVEGPHSCAAACEATAECGGFDYNKASRRCTLRSGLGHDVMFDRDGWQTFWHEQHFREWRAGGRLDFLRRLLFRVFGFVF